MSAALGGGSRTPDRRAMALSALGAFYLRQNFPDKAAPLLTAALRLMGDPPPAAGDPRASAADGAAANLSPADLSAEAREAVETTLRNLAYARLLNRDAGGALAILEGGRIAARTPADAAAIAHLTARARRLAQRKAADAEGGRR